jgi:hypothetical protein
VLGRDGVDNQLELDRKQQQHLMYIAPLAAINVDPKQTCQWSNGTRSQWEIPDPIRERMVEGNCQVDRGLDNQ